MKIVQAAVLIGALVLFSVGTFANSAEAASGVQRQSSYVELLLRIDRGYKDASNGFHAADSAGKIADAVNGFALPIQEVSDIIERQRNGLYVKPEQYATASRDALRMIDAQLAVLESAVQSAARADAAKVARIIVDQGVAARMAKVQQAADAELVRQIKNLIAQARSDVKEAGQP
jgi:hypothetical protein